MAVAAVFAMAAFPTVAFSQDPVGDLLKGVGGVVDGVTGGGGGGGVETQAHEDQYEPPLHGDNPHGQGTVGVVDLLPSHERPLSGDPAGSDEDGFPEGEEVVVGRSRGEQNEDGSYHGHVTILALLGNEVFGVDSDEEGSPFEGNPIQEDILDQICAESGGQLCLELLVAQSDADENSSENHFHAVDLGLGGEEGLSITVAESNGNIEDDGTCQTAHGDSSVLDVGAGGDGVVSIGDSSSTSTACNSQGGNASSVEQDSRWIVLGEGTENETEIPIPCGSGEEEEFVDPLQPLLLFICNANDEGEAGQADDPYGVREAFTVLTLVLPENEQMFEALLKATTAAAESHAVAPPEPPDGEQPPPPPGDDGRDGKDKDKDGPDQDEGGPGPAAGAAQAGDEDLAFTGADMAWLALIGTMLIAGGLGLARASSRRGRRLTS